MIQDQERRFVEFTDETGVATNGLVALAMAGRAKPMAAAAVAERAGSDPDYTHQALLRLERAGLVEADAAQPGSFHLSRPPSEVSLLDVAQAMGEPFRVHCCLNGRAVGDASCEGCSLRPVCMELRGDVVSLFRSRSIGDLVGTRV